MTCRFDLDCFNTRRFKPYTGKMQVSANYLSESDREGGRERESEMLSSARKLPHLLTCITAQPPAFSPVSAGLPSLCCCSNLTGLVAVQLWYDNTHLVIGVHSPASFIVLPQTSDRSLSFGSEREEERREVPPGTFLSHLSCLKDCCTWLAS